MLHHTDDIWTPEWFAAEVEAQLVKALAAERRTSTQNNRTTAREAARLQAPTDAKLDAHRLDATPTIEVADWFSDAPLVAGESNIATLMVPDTEYQRRWHKKLRRITAQETTAAPYEIETWQVLDDVGTVRWLQRDEAPYRVAWSEQDERRYVLGRLRWQARSLAAKHGVTGSVAVKRFPAARAAMQQAEAMKARWNFQHELARAGVEPTGTIRYEPTSGGRMRKVSATEWSKAAFGRTFDLALQEIRASREASRRQPFAAVRPGLI